jgi:hypothetical protein
MQDCFRAHPEIYLKGIEDHPSGSDSMGTSAMNADELKIEEMRHAEEQLVEMPQA